jgi:hypothetical protein
MQMHTVFVEIQQIASELKKHVSENEEIPLFLVLAKVKTITIIC